MTDGLADDFFRRAYADAVSRLVGRAGPAHLQAIEDAVQDALLRALEHWPRTGLPKSPTGWVITVAWNVFRDQRRTSTGRARILQDKQEEPSRAGVSASFANEVQDDLLKMLFVCCSDSLPPASRSALTLKVLAGLSANELSDRLFISTSAVNKRLARGRALLRESPPTWDLPPAAMTARLSSVHQMIYTLFTEGHLSSRPTEPIRRDLLNEAIRLTALLTKTPITAVPSTWALLSLLHLHRARVSARVHASHGLVLLHEQDRNQWDASDIRLGLTYLDKSSTGRTISRFHLEAGIAATHAMAPSMDETDWSGIASMYQQLETVAPSPLHRLNRIVATAEHQGPRAGLALLANTDAHPDLCQRSIWWAVSSDLHRRTGQLERAREHARQALERENNPTVRRTLERRLHVPSEPQRAAPRTQNESHVPDK